VEPARGTEEGRAEKRLEEAEAGRLAPAHGIGGLRIGRIAGIELYVDWSVAIIFALVAFGVGGAVLPRWHPDWSMLLRWVVALGAAVALVVSILVHELSHAIVGRAYGVRIPRITLFVFGGMAHMQGEPSTPKAELLMAAVGPLTSLVLGVLSSLIGSQLAVLGAGQAYNPEEVFRVASPVATLLLWLGPVNIALGIFNLVPGFPLDGGRVLRAAVWWATGSLDKATRWASGSGRVVGGILMGIGALMAFGLMVPFFGTGLGNGIWLLLIGWFLHSAARASYMELRLRTRLARVPVRDVMRSSLDTVTPEATIFELVREHIMRSDQTSFPVVEGDRLVGAISSLDVHAVPSDEWPRVTVRDRMRSVAEIPAVDSDAKASEALEALAGADLDQVPVTDHGRLAGFVRRQDILKWLSLQPDLAS
jgi:Zn-dependent protease/CBS domain-containing protein